MSKSWAELKALVVITNTGRAGMCRVGAPWPLLV
jgi:hypothetical protein